jgi:hypothetical protein
VLHLDESSILSGGFLDISPQRNVPIGEKTSQLFPAGAHACLADDRAATLIAFAAAITSQFFNYAFGKVRRSS